MLSKSSKQKLVTLADSLDKKGFKVEADLVDGILNPNSPVGLVDECLILKPDKHWIDEARQVVKDSGLNGLELVGSTACQLATIDCIEKKIGRNVSDTEYENLLDLIGSKVDERLLAEAGRLIGGEAEEWAPNNPDYHEWLISYWGL